ncbi:MAG: hypothetical protein WD181_04885 [Solirubrobacterales bacterium]
MSSTSPLLTESGAPEPADALRLLAARVEREGPPLTAVEKEPAAPPAFGLLAAAGPRTAPQGGVYAFVVEAVREGYLCHYGIQRVLESPDPDLALLAGDLFYAIGISTLAALGDDDSVSLLSDLIVVSAELRSVGRRDAAETFWLARVLALTCGSDAEHVDLTRALGGAETGSEKELDAWTDRTAAVNGISRHIDEVRHLIDFQKNP